MAVAEAIDLRELQENITKEDYPIYTQHKVTYYLGNKEVGCLIFSYVKRKDIVEIDIISVPDEYQNLGIGTMLYKKFGEIYSEQYSGIPVKRSFVNPVAEYAYRKAVSMGWVPQETLHEDKINRYYGEPGDAELAIDLRNKLPENVRGPEVWAKIAANATQIDLRRLTLDFKEKIEEDIDEEFNFESYKHKISASCDGVELGYLVFTETYQDNKRVKENLIYLAEIYVDDAVRELGIGLKLYQKFGEIYSQRFNGWEVERQFENPVAEYSFKKAIQLGYVPESAFTEHRTTRSYTPEQQKLWDEVLEPKLKQTTAEANEAMVSFTVDEFFTLEPDEAGNYTKHWSITMIYGSTSVVGDLNFTESVYPSENYYHLYIDNVEIDESSRNEGYGLLLYKKFGELYREKFNNYTVGRIFVNPVAEYTFMKAIELGYVPSEAFTEENTKRLYTDEESKLWNETLQPKLIDLRKNKKTAAPKIAETASSIDLRHLEFVHLDEAPTSYYGSTFTRYEIRADLNGEQVATLLFNYEVDANGQKRLNVSGLAVEDEYQNLGIGTALYGELGKLYAEKFNGLPVTRYFINPVAEYAFRKAVSIGLVPTAMLNEELVERSYDKPNDQWEYDKHQQWQDLRQKLPEQYRGAQVTAAPKVDEIDITYQVNNVEMSNLEGENYQATTITLTFKGDIAGTLIFAVYPEEERLYIENIEVWEVYRGLGLAQYLYKKFGELYKSLYNGWIVEREFQNPAAEAAFDKAIEMGWVPPEAKNENYTKRTY